MCRCCYCCSCVGHGGHRWWCYLGVALLVLLIPVQGVLQVWLMRYRADVNKLTDKVRQTGREGGPGGRRWLSYLGCLISLTTWHHRSSCRGLLLLLFLPPSAHQAHQRDPARYHSPPTTYRRWLGMTRE